MASPLTGSWSDPCASRALSCLWVWAVSMPDKKLGYSCGAAQMVVSVALHEMLSQECPEEGNTWQSQDQSGSKAKGIKGSRLMLESLIHTCSVVRLHSSPLLLQSTGRAGHWCYGPQQSEKRCWKSCYKGVGVSCNHLSNLWFYSVREYCYLDALLFGWCCKMNKLAVRGYFILIHLSLFPVKRKKI